jgi:hypothetical protein
MRVWKCIERSQLQCTRYLVQTFQVFSAIRISDVLQNSSTGGLTVDYYCDLVDAVKIVKAPYRIYPVLVPQSMLTTRFPLKCKRKKRSLCSPVYLPSCSYEGGDSRAAARR